MTGIDDNTDFFTCRLFTLDQYGALLCENEGSGQKTEAHDKFQLFFHEIKNPRGFVHKMIFTIPGG